MTKVNQIFTVLDDVGVFLEDCTDIQQAIELAEQVGAYIITDCLTAWNYDPENEHVVYVASTYKPRNID